MLIVEGPDGTGKTTLAQLIAEELGMEYRRAPSLSSTTGADQGVFEWWRSQLRENNPNVVYDRCFFVSEVLYQMATHERELLVTDTEAMRTGLADLWLKDARWIFCNPPWDVARGIIYSARDQLKGVTDLDLHKLHWAYDIWSMLMTLAYPDMAVRRYDFTHQSTNDLLDWVRKGNL